MRKLLWVEAEDAILRKYYVTEGLECYLRLPGRSRQAVYKRASVLGLKMPSRLYQRGSCKHWLEDPEQNRERARIIRESNESWYRTIESVPSDAA